MSLREDIKNAIKDAMRNKENAKRDTLRNIDTMIKQIEVDERRELSDEDVAKLIAKYAKQREDAKVQFANGGRMDLVEKEDAELAIIAEYLPKQLSDEELTLALKEIIAACGATTIKDMGKVMGLAKEKIGSRADGSRINTIVKNILA
jgi:uncharacterized protein YqeY